MSLDGERLGHGVYSSFGAEGTKNSWGLAPCTPSAWSPGRWWDRNRQPDPSLQAWGASTPLGDEPGCGTLDPWAELQGNEDRSDLTTLGDPYPAQGWEAGPGR